MTFLPIVDRELRVAARRRNTFWTRVITAGVAIIIFTAVVTTSNPAGRSFSTQTGSIFFSFFSWLAFGVTCLAGALLTSDCVSGEKRDGTLGLLFLTDLHGYDVVLGKLLGNSLLACYGLLAAFPVIGLVFLLGGVTGGQFWHVLLALCNSLFYSLCLGVLVSTLSRDSQRAMGMALGLGVVSVMLPAIDWMWCAGNLAAFVPYTSYLSPSFAFMQTRGAPFDFWSGLLGAHLTGWGMLATACWLIPRTWHETGRAEAATAVSTQRVRFGPAPRRAAFRKRLLEGDPMEWLAARELWAFPNRIELVLVTGFVLTVIAFTDFSGFGQVIVHLGSALFWLFFQTALAGQAARFFVEGRSSGALELLLVTPLTVEQIIRGVARSLLRAFGPICLALLVFQAWFGYLQIEMMSRLMSSGGPLAFFIFAVGGGLITRVTGLFALAWFAMWMGLTSARTHTAVIKTLLLVLFLPWLMLVLGQRLGMMGGFGMLAAPIISTAAGICLDVAFIVVSRRHVHRQLANFGGRTARSLAGAEVMLPSLSGPKRVVAT